MTSTCTARFWRLFASLPHNVQDVAAKNYRLWSRDPRHPSLHYKQTHGTLWSVRIGVHYRALADVKGTDVTWLWIGHHAEYDRLLRS